MVPNSVSHCRAEPFKVLAAAPRQRPDPVKRVGSGLRSQIGPLARRGIPGCLRSEHGSELRVLINLFSAYH